MVYIVYLYKVLVYCLDPLYHRRFLLVKLNLSLTIRSVLCYEIFKKWPLLSLFPDCICFSLADNRQRKKLPLFHLTIILEP